MHITHLQIVSIFNVDIVNIDKIVSISIYLFPQLKLFIFIDIPRYCIDIDFHMNRTTAVYIKRRYQQYRIDLQLFTSKALHI